MLIKTPWESACELAFDANYTCAGTQCIIESNSLIPSTGVTECIEQCELGDPTADSRLDVYPTRALETLASRLPLLHSFFPSSSLLRLLELLSGPVRSHLGGIEEPHHQESQYCCVLLLLHCLPHLFPECYCWLLVLLWFLRMSCSGLDET